jgi:p-hydroxybenzoate 3-monooxygenase
MTCRFGQGGDAVASHPQAQHAIRTQVGIVGAGPSGLLLAHLLRLEGISSVVVEARSRTRVENRVRAGQLEPATVEVLARAGVGTRLKVQSLPQPGVGFHYAGLTRRLDLEKLSGRGVTIYGQREVVRDLLEARFSAGGTIFFEASEVEVHGLDSDIALLSFRQGDQPYRIDCDFIAGCDGYHGVCRPTIAPMLTTFECLHPFGWLGILAEAPPISGEVLYACHERGLALFSMRSPQVSRLYLQCLPDEDLERWPDERIWSELRLRLDGRGAQLADGPVREKSVVRMRSFAVEPMQHGRLFLVGDAAHIVPPSAAKGLNLAVGDVCLLARALQRFYVAQDEQPLRDYSGKALPRVWEGQRFSQWMTRLLHRLGDGGPFDRRIQLAELDRLFSSDAAARCFIDAYVGRPLVDYPG